MSRLLCKELEPNNAEVGWAFYLRSGQLQAAIFNLIAKSTQQTIKRTNYMKHKQPSAHHRRIDAITPDEIDGRSGGADWPALAFRKLRGMCVSICNKK
jgi:hypothetical protein